MLLCKVSYLLQNPDFPELPSIWIILVSDGDGTHSVQAVSCTGRSESMQLHHSDKTLQRLKKKKTHMASVHCNQDRCVPFCTSLDREGRKKWSPPHLMPVYEKQAHTQLHFCSSYSPPSCPAGFPFSCAHDFGPPGTEFVLWKHKKHTTPPTNAHRSVRSHDYFWFPGWRLLWFRPWDHPDVAGYHRSPQILLGAQVSCSLLLCTIMLQQKSSSLPCLSSLFCPSSAISSTISSNFLLSSF